MAVDKNWIKNTWKKYIENLTNEENDPDREVSSSVKMVQRIVLRHRHLRLLQTFTENLE